MTVDGRDMHRLARFFDNQLFTLETWLTGSILRLDSRQQSTTLNVKVKVSTLYSALVIAGNLFLKRSGTVTHCHGISQFYLHTHAFIRGRNEPYLPLPSQPKLVLI